MAARKGEIPPTICAPGPKRGGRQFSAQSGGFVFQPALHAVRTGPAAKQVVESRLAAGRRWCRQIFLQPFVQPIRGGAAYRGIVQDAAQPVGRDQMPGHHIAKGGGNIVFPLRKQPRRQRHAPASDPPRAPRPKQHPDGQKVRHAADDRPDGHIQRKLYHNVHRPILSRRPPGPITEG